MCLTPKPLLLAALSVLIVLSTVTAHAKTLSCGIIKDESDSASFSEGESNLDDGSGPEIDIDVGFEQTIKMNCKSIGRGKYRSNDFIVEINGVGLAWRFVGHAEGLLIQCPGQSRVDGRYFGLKADAAFAVGVGVGLFAKADGIGACVLFSGSGGSGGLAPVAAQMIIRKIQ